jgi:phosphoserine aminotransferase
LRIWTGGTIEKQNLQSLMPWLNWAFETQISKL